jgi:dolichol kinase
MIREHIIIYLDAVIRGLIAFFVVGIGFYIFLVGFLHIKVIFVLPLIFIVSILISPFLVKIKLGEKVLDKYENWLRKTFKLKGEE